MARGESEAAIQLCRYVIGSEMTSEGQAYGFRDERAVRGMEDLAEIHRIKGEWKYAVLWLQAAAGIAGEIWEEHDVAKVHIVDKLQECRLILGEA
jgi:hypothetical protein